MTLFGVCCPRVKHLVDLLGGGEVSVGKVEKLIGEVGCGWKDVSNRFKVDRRCIRIAYKGFPVLGEKHDLINYPFQWLSPRGATLGKL